MAILPMANGKDQIEEYAIIGDIAEAPIYVPTKIKAGPQRLTIAEYKKRQQKIQEHKLTRIPKVPKPKHRRGGQIVRLRKRLADLRNTVNSDPPPSWESASIMWRKIGELEQQLLLKKQK